MIMKKDYMQPELLLLLPIERDVIATSTPDYEEEGGGDQVDW